MKTLAALTLCVCLSGCVAGAAAGMARDALSRTLGNTADVTEAVISRAMDKAERDLRDIVERTIRDELQKAVIALMMKMPEGGSDLTTMIIAAVAAFVAGNGTGFMGARNGKKKAG